MHKNQIWYGFMDAGKKSSPVLIDPALETGNPQTQYIFNLTRGEILEYNREIVEAKLRELTTDEADAKSQLTRGYKKAKLNFTPRARLKAAAVEALAGAPAPANSMLAESLDGAGYEVDAFEPEWLEEEAAE